ncbi:SRPBCC family protein [Streptantibioticus ferralitis]|uniref:SRPBCC family protein n=1 Tax=Streptantibioticus ferralitis TaxID=236510 RepID=A0ABT5YVN5_9ACTN|nr:SRPBCC family protein [Streptantibioticus ferralitis]MDF2255664.1 SRPBCC family protein [Streptantibioticus ferralitis]
MRRRGPSRRSGPIGNERSARTHRGSHNEGDQARFAQGPAAHCEVLVEAAPSRVWELVTDIGLAARLSPELRRVEWLDDATAPALGARFAGFNHHPMLGDWRTVSQIVELSPQRVFGWVVMDAHGRHGEPAQDPSKPLATWRGDARPGLRSVRQG